MSKTTYFYPPPPEEPTVLFSWERVSNTDKVQRDPSLRGHRVVLYFPTTGTIRVEAPETEGVVVLTCGKYGCSKGGAKILDRPEPELLALSKEIE